MKHDTLDDYDHRRIESLANPILFEELLELASDICFGRQLSFIAKDKVVTPESDIVATLGMRGLRTALDMISPGVVVDQPEFEGGRTGGEEDTTTEYIWLDSPMRNSKEFDDKPDADIVDKVQQFGEALLADAYKVLGQDVFQKIREFKNATTDEEQFMVAAWLDQRLSELTYNHKGLLKSEDDAVNDILYHPIRLSPKVLGVYPHHALAPTCLSISVITSSFFEQASADHLHAGVMMSEIEHRMALLHNLAEDAADHLVSSSSDVSDEVLQSLRASSAQSRERFNRDQGYHAANYVKLISGRWMQVDSNFNATTPIFLDEHNERISHAYKDIKEFSAVAPGLERSIPLGVESLISTFADMLKIIKPLRDEEIAQIEQVLLHEDESIIQKIHTIYFARDDDVVSADREKSTDDELTKNIMSILSREPFNNLFVKYVLWGEPIEMVQEQCRKDSAYLARRINDINNLMPLLVTAAGIEYSNLQNASNDKYPAHALIEVGNPAHRIGFAVLSDIALYLDNRLPPSFWLKNWNSLVPLTETIPENADTISLSEQTLLANLGAVYGGTHFAYTKSHDIIAKFQTTIDEMENEHGKDRP